AIVSCTLGLAAPTLSAQVSWGFRAGVARPTGTFDDYFDLGPTVGVEAAYPVLDRVDLIVGADFDHYNGHAYFGTPNVNLWRIQAGLTADLARLSAQGWAIEAHASAGGANLRSQREFYLESSTFGVDLDPRTF